MMPDHMPVWAWILVTALGSSSFMAFAGVYELTAGQSITVAAQNGTADATITVTITLDGHQVSESGTGANRAVTATSKEAK